MTSWFAIKYYSPLFVLIFGILTFTGMSGLGLAIQHIMRLSLPAPWHQTIGVLLGVQIVSLMVQALGMGGLAYRPVLISIWLLTVIPGNIFFAKWVLPLAPGRYEKPTGLALLPFLFCLTGLAVNLLVAMAPAVRNDELHYHMLIPSRIVFDNAIQFYRQPWEGAIWPHMIYQIANTPLHAIGFPDGANVVTWGLSLTLVWFGWYLISERTTKSLWHYAWIAPIVIGYWPVVYHVTGGAQGMSDLATAVAMVALFKCESLIRKIGINKFAFLFSISLLSIAISKLSYAPLALALLISLVIILWKKEFKGHELFHACLYFVVPWMIFYLPILLWTFWQSGSPYGPVLNGLFSYSAYDKVNISSTFKIIIEAYSSTPQRIISQIKKFAIRFPPLFWLAFAGLVSVSNISKRIRFVAVFLLSFQLILLLTYVPFEGRFISAIFQGFLLSFAIFCPLRTQNRIIKINYRFKSLLIVIFFLPWLFVQTYYAYQFLPISLGFQEKNAFFKKYISFYPDFQELDSILPIDSVILMQGFTNVFKIWQYQFRMSSVYSPRPIYFEIRDLPQDKSIILLQLNKPEDRDRLDVPQGYELGELIYQNDHAIYCNLARIGRPPRELVMKVHELHSKVEIETSYQSFSQVLPSGSSTSSSAPVVGQPILIRPPASFLGAPLEKMDDLII